jgi:hypothetical protein
MAACRQERIPRIASSIDVPAGLPEWRQTAAQVTVGRVGGSLKFADIYI